MAQQEVETRKVVNRLKHADGSIEDITVTERRPKRRHDSMMRHMENLAAQKRKRDAENETVVEETADASPVI